MPVPDDSPDSDRAPAERDTTPANRGTRYRSVLVGFFMVLLAAIRAAAPEERDPYWSARAGVENLAGLPLARLDTWSWSAEGVWYQNSPGWNTLLGAMWQWLGYWGLFLIPFVSLLAYLGLVWAVAAKAGARALPGFAGLAATLTWAYPLLNARATVPVQSLALVGTLFAWWWARRSLRLTWPAAATGALVSAAGLSVVGNWLHVSFLFIGTLMSATWVLIFVLTKGLPGRMRIALSVAGISGFALGAALSPHGIPLTLQRTLAVKEACEGLILEWSSVFAVNALQWYLSALFALALAALTAWLLVELWRASEGTDPRIPLVAALVAIGLPSALAGVFAIRFLGLSLLTLAPLSAVIATRVAHRVRGWAVARPPESLGARRVIEYTSAHFWMVVLTCVAVLLVVPAGLLISRGARPPELGVIARLPAGCRLLSGSGVAAPVILSRPDVTVWTDGRGDFYGRALLIQAQQVLLGQAPIPQAASCAILPVDQRHGREYRALASALDSDPDWSRTAEIEGFALWERR